MPAPLTDSVIFAVARLVDDARVETRQPSHSDLDFQIGRAGLTAGDPKADGQLVGKAKRVRAALNWALTNDIRAGEALVESLIAFLRGCGGFRAGSPNYVGAEVITDAIGAFRAEGFVLSQDGELLAVVLDNLSGTELSAALACYVRRAQQGAQDAALLTGTGKDLLEATAAHILLERNGMLPSKPGENSLIVGLADNQVVASGTHRVARDRYVRCRLGRRL